MKFPFFKISGTATKVKVQTFRPLGDREKIRGRRCRDVRRCFPEHGEQGIESKAETGERGAPCGVGGKSRWSKRKRCPSFAHSRRLLHRIESGTGPNLFRNSMWLDLTPGRKPEATVVGVVASASVSGAYQHGARVGMETDGGNKGRPKIVSA